MSNTYRPFQAFAKITLLTVAGTTLGLIGILRFTNLETRMDTIAITYLGPDGTQKQEDISWMRRQGAQHYADALNTALRFPRHTKPGRVAKVTYCPIIRSCENLPIVDPRYD